MWEARVGMKVVSLYDWATEKTHKQRRGIIAPAVDQVLTIRNIYTDRSLGYQTAPNGKIYLTFNEIVNNPIAFNGGFHEPAFDSNEFRPLRTTNIDCLIAIANKPPTKDVFKNTAGWDKKRKVQENV